MTVIVCLDKNNGMLFNRRRQSRDRALRCRILELTKRSKLYMNEFSYKQFEEQAENIITDEDFLQKAGESDFCFVENLPLKPYREKIQKIIVYRWNKTYPADLYFDLNLENYTLASTAEFAGSSHEKIIEEVYTL